MTLSCKSQGVVQPNPVGYASCIASLSHVSPWLWVRPVRASTAPRPAVWLLGELHDVAFSPLGQRQHMVGPACQRGAYFALIAMPVIDRLDAALDVIDRKLGDMWRNAELAESGAHRSTQIVKRPVRQCLAGRYGDTGIQLQL